MNAPRSSPALAPAHFLARGSLATPTWLVDSAWHQHAPFGSWLVQTLTPTLLVELGTHNGFSYFTFCQSASDLDTPTRCFAVDHWHGDTCTGPYGEEVYDAVNGHNQALYSTFSTLLRSDFDAAVKEIGDATVDLLHIDGDHSYAAVSHDFQTWLPKMSPRGVVLLHDIAEYGDGYEVPRLWQELADRYPVFAFTHGHGLGLVLVGDDPPPLLADLAAHNATATGAAVREWYARLGQAVSAEWELRSLRAELGAAQSHVQQLHHDQVVLQSQVDERNLADHQLLADTLGQAVADAHDLRAQLRGLVENITDQSGRSAEERAMLWMRLAAAEAAVGSLTSAIESSADQATVDQMHREALAAQRALDEVLSSRSWRVTGPMRRLLGH